MKKVIALTLAVLMCLTLMIGCGGRENAKTAVTNAMTALQKMDNDGIVKYFGEDASVADAFASEDPNDESAKEMATAMMGSMTFKVGEVKEDGDTATATVTLTNKDMEKIMNDFVTALLADVISGKLSEDSMTQEASMQYFKDAMNACTDTVSNEVTLPMTYTEEAGWQIAADVNLADAMTGNMLSVMSSFAG